MFLRSKYVISRLQISYIKRLPFKSVQQLRICLQSRVATHPLDSKDQESFASLNPRRNASLPLLLIRPETSRPAARVNAVPTANTTFPCSSCSSVFLFPCGGPPKQIVTRSYWTCLSTSAAAVTLAPQKESSSFTTGSVQSLPGLRAAALTCLKKHWWKAVQERRQKSLSCHHYPSPRSAALTRST